MTLTGIKPGDIVLVNDGMTYYGKVHERLRGQLVVRALHGSTALRRAKAREVVGLWRKSRS